MRRTVPVLLLIIGAVGILIGIGQLTFMAPAKNLSASVPQGTHAAPLTLITQKVRDAASDGATLTVHGDGQFRAVVGRASDVDAWVGDAAANVISDVDEDAGTFKVQNRAGQDKAPDPAGSDLWVTDQKHSGMWDVSWNSTDGSSSWTVPADGDWTLMLATDGTKAAPLDITMSWENPAATGSAKFQRAIWWFIGGLVVIIGAAVLFFGGRGQQERARAQQAAASPRRAARYATETGQLPVLPDMVPPPGSEDADDDVMARPASEIEPERPGVRTVEDPWAGAPSVRQARLREEEQAAGLSDDTIVQRPVRGAAPEAEQQGQDVPDAAGQARAGSAPAGAWSGAEDATEDEDAVLPKDADKAAKAEQADKAEPQDAADKVAEDATDPKADEPKLPGGPADDTEPGKAPKPGKGLPRGLRARRGGAAALTAIALAMPAAPVLADSATPSGESSDASQSAASSSEAAQAQPVLVDVQLKRIMEQVSTAATNGDKAKDASKLDKRFSGSALTLHKDYYAAAKKKVKLDASAVPSIASSPLRATAVTTTQEWPRVAMVLSQGKGQTYPVAVTLQQDSPRSNYTVVQAVEMVPDAKFPGVALGAPEVTTQPADQSGLVDTPAKVVNGFADWLKNSKSSWAPKFESNDFVTSWRKAMDAQTKDAKKNKGHVQTSFSVDTSSIRTLSAPQGGSYVSANITQTTVVSAEKGGKHTLSGLAKQFTGESSTTKKVVTTYAMPVFFYVPAAGDGKISLVARGYLPTQVRLK